MSNRNIVVPVQLDVTVKLTPEQLAEQFSKLYDSELVIFFNELPTLNHPVEFGAKIIAALSHERTDNKTLNRSARYLLQDLADTIRDSSEAKYA
ncbi:Uncharacterised protein [Serratia quinivorans]|uniref:hypothetical protein n=1 Tax=Serratia quinivorans TaxID=137545 RepID=UPI002178318E|nr:hypothetical protein [Serratia quinivorans]CAI1818873.1 Uncharacterised protein [Serratia quinivorans]